MADQREPLTKLPKIVRDFNGIQGLPTSQKVIEELEVILAIARGYHENLDGKSWFIPPSAELASLRIAKLIKKLQEPATQQI